MYRSSDHWLPHVDGEFRGRWAAPRELLFGTHWHRHRRISPPVQDLVAGCVLYGSWLHMPPQRSGTTRPRLPPAQHSAAQHSTTQQRSVPTIFTHRHDFVLHIRMHLQPQFGAGHTPPASTMSLDTIMACRFQSIDATPGSITHSFEESSPNMRAYAPNRSLLSVDDCPPSA